MPKKLEEKLKKDAKSKGFGKDRAKAFVYGTLRKTGWKPTTTGKMKEKPKEKKGKK